MFSVGKHLLVDIKGCNPDKLKRVEYVSDLLHKATLLANATIVSKAFKQFEPHGVSGVIVIEESHFTIHTWPEHGFASIDFYSCSEGVDMQGAIDFLQEELEATSYSSTLLNRGDLKVEAYDKGTSPHLLREKIISVTKEPELNEVVL